MKLKLAGRVSEASGRVNEDAVGHIGEPDDIQAAWVLDGVTGINQESPALPAATHNGSWRASMRICATCCPGHRILRWPCRISSIG
jgi:hypothetical protein